MASRTTSPQSARTGVTQTGIEILVTKIRFPRPSIAPRTRNVVLESVNRAELLGFEGASSTMSAQRRSQSECNVPSNRR